MLSVLLPVYNAQGKLAADAAEILEVLSQWHGPFELCILDDGSTDETAEEARELSALYPQVRLIRHPVRLGLAEAIQTGLDHTHGEVVLLGDEDYCLDPDDLRTLWRLRDAQRELREQGRRKVRQPRLEKLLGWKPGAGAARRRFHAVHRDEFEQFRLGQAADMLHRLDAPRPSEPKLDPATAIARRLGQPKFLKLSPQFSE
jgi:glycosyltransferase involved in cell wall biosynthesis